MDVLTKLNCDKICRCCLFSQEQGLSLLNAWHLEIYCAITSLQFKNEDKRSKLICQQCTAKMKIIKEFAEVCIESDKKLTAIENKAKDIIKIETVNEYDTAVILIIENEPENTIKHENDVSNSEEMTEDSLNENQEISCDEEVTDGKMDNMTMTNDSTALNSETKPHLNKFMKVKNSKIGSKRGRVETLVCNKCHAIFATEMKLRRHKLLHHKEEEHLDNQTEENTNNQTFVKPSTSELNSCYTCKAIFATAILRNMHYAESETCQPKPIICEVCNRSFKNNQSLKDHEISHKEERNFSCNECIKTFKYYRSLRWHKKIQHKKEELKYVCTFCGKRFGLPCYLKQHLECHIRTDAYVCDECGQKFTNKRNLRRHKLNKIKKAQGQSENSDKSPEASFLCSECGKGLSSKASLEIHMRSHTGEKPFKCPHCPKATTTQASLTSHIRIHFDIRPYACDLCDKTFVQGPSLARHKLIHSTVKPNKCNLCGMGFKTQANLKIHMLIHTGDKPLTCPHCDERFSHYKSKSRHMLRVHGVSTSKPEIVKLV